MNQSLEYVELVKAGLTSYVQLAQKKADSLLDVVTVFDDESQRYLVMEVGWQASTRVQHLILHVSIQEGKIWIEEDWTEDGIATYFLKQGVPKDQIVLGFQAPNLRQYGEFAVA